MSAAPPARGAPPFARTAPLEPAGARRALRAQSRSNSVDDNTNLECSLAVPRSRSRGVPSRVGDVSGSASAASSSTSIRTPSSAPSPICKVWDAARQFRALSWRRVHLDDRRRAWPSACLGVEVDAPYRTHRALPSPPAPTRNSPAQRSALNARRAVVATIDGVVTGWAGMAAFDSSKGKKQV